MSLRALLRNETAEDHVRLDAAFAAFDLSRPDHYRRFLLAHARALPPIEAAIAATGPSADWQPRLPLLRADLAAFGEVPPAAFTIPPPGEAELWGMRYVVEGSRLGGVLLARRVGAGLPCGYLGAQHGKGEWRGFLDGLEQAGAVGGADWADLAIAGARQAFALFARSVAEESAPREQR